MSVYLDQTNQNLYLAPTPKPRYFPILGAAKKRCIFKFVMASGIDLSRVNFEVIEPVMLELSSLVDDWCWF